MLNKINGDSEQAEKLGVSSVILKNWVGLVNSSEKNMQSTSNHKRSSFFEELNKETFKIKDDTSSADSHYVNKPAVESDNLSYAHCLYQSIETLVNGLIEKVNVLHSTQLDIHHVEIITDRVFHNIEKLKNEIRATCSYVQEIEDKNRNLEAKLDTLLMQNDVITQKMKQFDLVYERFFSKNTELENRLLAFEHKIYHSNENENELPKIKKEEMPKVKITTDLEEDFLDSFSDNFDNDFKTEKELQEISEKYGHIFDDNLDDLMKSKKEVENFIRKNYPSDYSKMKTYDKNVLIKWFNKVLKL